MNRTELAKEIIIYRDKGLTIKEISIKINMTFEQVRYILKKENISMSVKQMKQCAVCDKEFKTKKKNAKTCCRKCSDKLFEQNRKAKHKYICRCCGKEFKHVSRKEIKFCSEECLVEHNKIEKVSREKERELKKLELRVAQTKCIQCNCNFEKIRSNARFCSADCKRLYNNNLQKQYARGKQSIPKFDKRCKECGKHFSTTYSAKVYCNNACKNKYNYRSREVSRRHKMIDNGSVDWSISVGRLYKRDKGECYLCGGRCNKNDYHINDNNIVICGDDYPSIDHVIPISKGGTHSWNNVRLAHRRCNTIKRDKLLEV